MRMLRDIMFMLTGVAVTCAVYELKDPVMNKLRKSTCEDFEY